MYSKIDVGWKIEGNKINIRVEIPHNTSSVIIFPDVKDVEKLKENIIKAYNEKELQINISSDRPLETYTDTDFKFNLLDDDSLSFEVGSGIFTFVYDYKK
ncbi:alpha-L-rhamnosidase C-terminal domain-containing protein [Clostridium estertheticum]|uniref:alpha-L-rhamnosidase C-terminal domain-containing protein n=1 Tax=Clostridium estertheticum TaxID=238834 RepID=UPI0021F3DB31|nr:alpha-L-rhamnosidase C-terminal domain-containing protein [Clostridium estertheticum]